MGTPSSRSALTYVVRLTPRAEEQIRELSPVISAVVHARLQRLAVRSREKAERNVTREPTQRQLLGRTFRALYEVDHDERMVTVLDVAPRS